MLGSALLFRNQLNLTGMTASTSNTLQKCHSRKSYLRGPQCHAQEVGPEEEDAQGGLLEAEQCGC